MHREKRAILIIDTAFLCSWRLHAPRVVVCIQLALLSGAALAVAFRDDACSRQLYAQLLFPLI